MCFYLRAFPLLRIVGPVRSAPIFGDGALPVGFMGRGARGHVAPGTLGGHHWYLPGRNHARASCQRLLNRARCGSIYVVRVVLARSLESIPSAGNYDRRVGLWDTALDSFLVASAR